MCITELVRGHREGVTSSLLSCESHQTQVLRQGGQHFVCWATPPALFSAYTHMPSWWMQGTSTQRREQSHGVNGPARMPTDETSFLLWWIFHSLVLCCFDSHLLLITGVGKAISASSPRKQTMDYTKALCKAESWGLFITLGWDSSRDREKLVWYWYLEIFTCTQMCICKFTNIRQWHQQQSRIGRHSHGIRNSPSEYLAVKWKLCC